jgi:hypothetical protein
MIAHHQEHPSVHMIVTYEGLRSTPAPILAGLFRFLGVPDREDIVADCLARTAFAVQTGGRPAGVEANGAFLRKGEVGTWRSTLTDQMNDMILAELGWMFPHFGWS